MKKPKGRHKYMQWIIGQKILDTSLWRAALKHYTNLRNSLTTQFVPVSTKGQKELSNKYESSPLNILSISAVKTNLDYWHPLGSPYYVLENELKKKIA